MTLEQKVDAILIVSAAVFVLALVMNADSWNEYQATKASLRHIEGFIDRCERAEK